MFDSYIHRCGLHRRRCIVWRQRYLLLCAIHGLGNKALITSHSFGYISCFPTQNDWYGYAAYHIAPCRHSEDYKTSLISGVLSLQSSLLFSALDSSYTPLLSSPALSTAPAPAPVMFASLVAILPLALFGAAVNAQSSDCARNYTVHLGDVCDSISAAQNVSTCVFSLRSFVHIPSTSAAPSVSCFLSLFFFLGRPST